MLVKDKKEFALKLKNALKIRGYSQRELAKETGIVQPTISTYCSGKYIPNEKNFKKIIEALDIDEDYFKGIYMFDNEIEQKEELIKEEKKENTVVFDKKNRQDVYLEFRDTTEILRIARELGALRYELIQIIEKDRETVDEFNRKDQKMFQTIVHKLEFSDELTDEEIIKYVREDFKEVKEERESRRIVKERMYLVKELLNAMLIKNPNAFVTQAINGKGDILKTIECLKKDKSLYAG